jgi:hypothetical protein
MSLVSKIHAHRESRLTATMLEGTTETGQTAQMQLDMQQN